MAFILASASDFLFLEIHSAIVYGLVKKILYAHRWLELYVNIRPLQDNDFGNSRHNCLLLKYLSVRNVSYAYKLIFK